MKNVIQLGRAMLLFALVSCSPKMAPQTSSESKPNESMGASTASTGGAVISTYLATIGGVEKLSKINDIKITMEGNTAMGSMTMTTMKKNNTMMAMTIESNGMIFMDQRYNGTKASITSPQGSEEITDEEALKNFSRQAVMFPELNYFKEGYKIELVGTEEVKGQSQQVVKITTPDGKEIKEFYDPQSHLKIKTEIEAEVQGLMRTIVNETSDYREVNGVKIPYSLTISGAMPMALKLEVSDVKINSGLSNSLFEAN